MALMLVMVVAFMPGLGTPLRLSPPLVPGTAEEATEHQGQY
jgi:hypothetical protein